MNLSATSSKHDDEILDEINSYVSDSSVSTIEPLIISSVENNSINDSNSSDSEIDFEIFKSDNRNFSNDSIEDFKK